MGLNPQAEELNDVIKRDNPIIFDLLSEKGKAIFFPKTGIQAQSGEAKGKRINATIGIALEDDGSPMRLNAISKNISLDPKEVFPYAPSYGNPDIRKAWKEVMLKKNPSLAEKKISLPVVTSALTHGLSLCGYIFLDEGDKVIMPDIYWGNYRLVFDNGFGAKIDGFNSFKDGGFDVAAMKEKLMAEGEKKVLLLNFPSNPSGYTPTEEEAKQIAEAVKEAANLGKKIVVIFDDAYFGLVYKEGVYKESLFSEVADLSENVLAVKLDGATKEDYVWGLRTGFITFACKGITDDVCEAFESKTAGAIRGGISNSPNLSQNLVLHALTSSTYDEEKKEKYNILKERFEKVSEVLETKKEYEEFFKSLPYNSGYFMCIKLNDDLDAEIIRKILLEKYDTGLIAMGNILRIAFSAVKKDAISELFDNVYKACKGE